MAFYIGEMKKVRNSFFEAYKDGDYKKAIVLGNKLLQIYAENDDCDCIEYAVDMSNLAMVFDRLQLEFVYIWPHLLYHFHILQAGGGAEEALRRREPFLCGHAEQPCDCIQPDEQTDGGTASAPKGAGDSGGKAWQGACGFSAQPVSYREYIRAFGGI